MMKTRILSCCLIIISGYLSACMGSKPSTTEAMISSEGTVGPTEQIYSPSYYTYRNGRYTFSKGKYEKVSRKYHERNLKGFMYKDDNARARGSRKNVQRGG